LLNWTHVLEALTGNQREASLVISEAAVDSRQVIPGSLFIALPGERADGSSRFRAGMGFRPEDRLVGAIGRMVWQKGFEYLIRGIPDVLKACPQARFLFVGDGPLRESLQALSSRLGLGAFAFFTGFQRDIRDVLSALDLCVIPSLREGFPMVTLEAMAMAKPIVATPYRRHHGTDDRRSRGFSCSAGRPDGPGTGRIHRSSGPVTGSGDGKTGPPDCGA